MHSTALSKAFEAEKFCFSVSIKYSFALYSTPRKQTVKNNVLFLNGLELANNVPKMGFFDSHKELKKG
jgi:hypothetical protein